MEEKPLDQADEKEIAAAAEAPVDSSALPAWASAAEPEEMTYPQEGTVWFLRLLPDVTGRPKLGERVIIVWALSVRDERNARSRAQTLGEGVSTIEEYTKAMLRAWDGKKLDWAKPSAAIELDKFWEEVGPKYRSLLTAWYLRTHQLSDEDRLRFFAQCVASRSIA